MNEKFTVLDEIKNNINDKEKLAEVIFEICFVFDEVAKDTKLKAEKEVEDKKLSLNEYLDFRKNMDLNIIKDILDSSYLNEFPNKFLSHTLKNLFVNILKEFIEYE